MLHKIILSILVSFSLVQTLRGQEVAFFSFLRGAVVVQEDGKDKPARPSMPLLRGAQVITGKGSYATIMYFTGKEVDVQPETRHIIGITSPDSLPDPALGRSLHSLLWGGSMTRDLTTAKGKDEQKTGIVCMYPVQTNILEHHPRFSWIDRRQGGPRSYAFTMWSKFTRFKTEKIISGKTELQLDSIRLSQDDIYLWSVRDVNDGTASEPAQFALLYEDSRRSLEQDMASIRALCNGDSTSLQWHFVTSALFWKYDLMKEAKESLMRILETRPEFAPAHAMLAQIYKKTGLESEAEKEERQAEDLWKKQ